MQDGGIVITVQAGLEVLALDLHFFRDDDTSIRTERVRFRHTTDTQHRRTTTNSRLHSPDDEPTSGLLPLKILLFYRKALALSRA